MKKPEPDSPFSPGADGIDSFFRKRPSLPPCPPPASTEAQPGSAAAKNNPPQAPKEEGVPDKKPEVPTVPGEDQAEERFPSLLIDTSDFEAEFGPMRVSIDEALRGSGAGHLLEKFASLFSRLHPGSEGKELRFSSDSVFLDSRKIGDVSLNPGGPQARIWLHELGYSLPMLPTPLLSSIEKEFKTFPGFVAKSLSSNSYISILAEQSETRKSIRICFHKSMNSPPSSSAPVKFL